MFSGEILGLVVLSGVGVLSEESEDVGEVEERATTFSGEVVDLVVLSGFGSGESEDVDDVEERAMTFSGDVIDLMLDLSSTSEAPFMKIQYR